MTKQVCVVVPDLVRRRHCRPRRCGLPHKRPAGCLRDLQGLPGTPGPTRCSTAGRRRALPAARSPETGGEASSLSGRSDDVCTTSQLENIHKQRKRNGDMRRAGMQLTISSITYGTAGTTADKLKSPDNHKWLSCKKCKKNANKTQAKHKPWEVHKQQVPSLL